MDTLRYTFIFNPAADKGRAAVREPWLRNMVSGMHAAVVKRTAYAGHAGDIAREACQESDCLVACGGDGTLHEVVNASFGSDLPIGVIPIGSANDFIKTLQHGGSVVKNMPACFSGQSRTVDLGSVLFNGDKHRYFVNSLGIGFTGRIAGTVRRTTWAKGELGYIHALFSVLIGYAPLKMHIKITSPDSVYEMHEPVFAFSVSNGRVEGGKFRIAPEADPADGLLDVCILKSIPNVLFLGYVIKYLRGSQIFDSRVIYCKASSVEVTIPDSEMMHMDGEVFEHIKGKIRISVVPGALRVFS